VTQTDGSLVAREEQTEAQWSLNALAQAAKAAVISVKRSQIRRICLREGAGFRQIHSWGESSDKEFVPKEERSSATPLSRRRARLPSVPMRLSNGGYSALRASIEADNPAGDIFVIDFQEGWWRLFRSDAFGFPEFCQPQRDRTSHSRRHYSTQSAGSTLGLGTASQDASSSPTSLLQLV
jgi:hypothetical protein